MVLRRLASVLVVGGLLVLTAACDLLDPARPTPQPDTEIFGNLMEVSELPDAPGQWAVTVRVGVPRAVARGEGSVGHMVPEVDDDLSAEITVDHDTVVLHQDKMVAVRDFRPGTEVVAIPSPGSTVMIGSSNLELKAAYLLDFETYRRWRLPRLAGDDPAPRDQSSAINSDGVEHSPVPLAGGRVLYFTARLRPPARANQGWNGVVREGVGVPAEGGTPKERSFRTALGEDGWSEAGLVVLPGTENAALVRVSWVNEDETVLLATVAQSGEASWVGRAERADSRAGWGALQRLEALGEDAASAVYLAGSESKITFVSGRGGGRQTDLYLFDPDTEDGALPLEPRINTLGNEWSPRVGPNNELFFNRVDRQMLFANAQVTAVRLPTPHRALVTQAAPTADGRWVFFCLPRLRPGDLDQDIYVAPLTADGGLGDAVAVDEWRPVD